MLVVVFVLLVMLCVVADVALAVVYYCIPWCVNVVCCFCLWSVVLVVCCCCCVPVNVVLNVGVVYRCG